MKIVFINPFYYPLGGAEIVMLNEIDFLLKSGHEVSIFSVNNKKNLNSNYSKYFVEKDIIQEKIESKIPLNFLEKINYCLVNINNTGSAKKFKIFLDEVKPDLIHSHGYSRMLSPTIFELAKKFRIPVLTTEHNPKLVCPIGTLKFKGDKYCYDKLCIKGNYFNVLIHKCNKGSMLQSLQNFLEFSINKKRYIKNIDGITVPSLYLKNLLIEAGIDQKKIVHLKNFVNLNKFNYQESNSGYFLYFGRLSFEKGLLTLIKAFELLPELSLKIVGEGAEETILRKYIKEKNIKNIEFLGKKRDEELVKAIQGSKATILPSEWGENAPLSILESFSCGKPVIGANIGGIPEMINDGVDGYLFESGNVEDLKQKILNIFEKDTNILQMGKTARKKAEENYTIEAHGKALLNIYNNVLENR